MSQPTYRLIKDVRLYELIVTTEATPHTWIKAVEDEPDIAYCPRCGFYHCTGGTA